MNPGVNIEDVKKYNAELKMYQDKAAQIKVGIDFNTAELKRLCDELSNELGVPVTPENIVQIRDEHIAKIENTLRVGNEILARIKSEEQQANSKPVNPPVMNTGAVNQPTAQPASQPVAPIFAAGAANPMQDGVTPPAAPNVFGSIGNVPPIFGNIGG